MAAEVTLEQFVRGVVATELRALLEARPPPGPDDWLKTPDVAKLCGLSGQRIEALRREGGGPPFSRIGRRRIRYRRADVMSWLAGRG